jgi:predicted Zn-dependent protease
MFAEGHAELVRRRGKPEEALRQCEFIRKRFPNAVGGYRIAAVTLANLGRHQESEAILNQADQKFPLEYDVRRRYALYAARRQDWPEALLRWQAIRKQFDLPEVATNISQSLRAMGRYPEAEAIVTGMSNRFPGDLNLHAELAGIAADNGELDKASQSWALLRTRSPSFVLAYTSGAEVARLADREADADAILSEGVTRVTSDLGIHLEYARSAQRLGNWTAAVERWALVRERFPECREAREQETRALQAVKEQDQAVSRH